MEGIAFKPPHTLKQREERIAHIHASVCVFVSREHETQRRCAEKAACCSGHGNLLPSQLGGPSWLLTAPGQEPGTGAREGKARRTTVGVDNRASEKNENLSPSEFPALSGMKRLSVCSC